MHGSPRRVGLHTPPCLLVRTRMRLGPIRRRAEPARPNAVHQAIYRIFATDPTTSENTSPNPIITLRSNNQTIGVILPFTSHLLYGLVRRYPELHTVYNIRDRKSRGRVRPRQSGWQPPGDLRPANPGRDLPPRGPDQTCPSFVRINSWTAFGSAFPPVALITWPVKRPSRLVLPARYAAALSGMAAKTASNAAESSEVETA